MHFSDYLHTTYASRWRHFDLKHLLTIDYNLTDLLILWVLAAPNSMTRLFWLCKSYRNWLKMLGLCASIRKAVKKVRTRSVAAERFQKWVWHAGSPCLPRQFPFLFSSPLTSPFSPLNYLPLFSG